MSPSTKNLKERIWKILDQSNTWKESADKLESLLSSELSLAVKGLREAINLECKRGDDIGLLMTRDGFVHEYDWETYREGAFDATQRNLERFDSKAKEILGESS